MKLLSTCTFKAFFGRLFLFCLFEKEACTNRIIEKNNTLFAQWIYWTQGLLIAIILTLYLYDYQSIGHQDTLDPFNCVKALI